MKKPFSLTLPVLTFTFLALGTVVNLNAQQRCGTYQAIESLFSKNPAARSVYDADVISFQKAFDKKIADIKEGKESARANATLYIPVVVHIIMPNPNIVTDATVQSQLDVLNADYSGMNPDSIKIVAGFKPLHANGNIRFCLAQRDPNGNMTTGINRVTSNTMSTTSVGDPVKYTANGGMNAWDPAKYLNIWVCVMDAGLLGYSYPPGIPIPLNERGFVNDYRAFGKGAAYLYPGYNLGRTAVHEIGHFLNLQHIWGPNNCDGTGSCSDDDGVADTPLQYECTFSCPSIPGTVITDQCSPASPGIMYQNFMDYGDDACLLLFTPGQNTRMETAISSYSFLSSLVTSNGCTPIGVPNDASIAGIVNPQNNSGCLGTSTPLTVILRNTGINALTSVTIKVENNSVNVQTFNWTGNLAPQASINIALNPLNLANGANIITVCTSNPNGVPDAAPSNDCDIATVNGSPASWPTGLLPVTEGFESSIFPTTGWSIINPDAQLTWQRTTTGTAHGGTGKAWINHFNYPGSGQTDDLLTPSFGIGPADSLWVSFWGTYKSKANITPEMIEVGVSTDCGNNFTTVYSANANTDFTDAPVNSSVNWSPYTLTQWKKKVVNLSSFIPSGNIILRFRMKNMNNNNFFLDDINIDKLTFKNQDAGVIAINKPNTRECTGASTPEVVIKNFGVTNLTSARINYTIDGGSVNFTAWNGNLARNQTAVVTLPQASFSSPGNHTIKVYTSLPNGIADEQNNNDTLLKSFTATTIVNLPGTVTESFSSSFPPTGWSVYNPDGDMTWTRNANYGNSAVGSAFFNDWNNPTNNRFDDLFLPAYSFSGIDSLFLKFNVATVAAAFPNAPDTPIDTLSILLSKDCGNTYTTIYKKWGATLHTVSDGSVPTNVEFFPAAASHWRQDSIYLGPFVGNSEQMMQLAFRFNGNFQNNIFLDDINLRAQVLPTRLKNQGYLIFPNPFAGKFTIWHYLTPTDLQYVNVYNMSGQLVWSKQFSGDALRLVFVDLSKQAPGSYAVVLGYTDKSKTVKTTVIKGK